MTFDGSTTDHHEPSRGSFGGDDRLAQILDDYLRGLEGGEAVAPAELLARHPDVAPRLRDYLSGLELIHQVAARPLPLTVLSPVGGELRGDLGDFRLIRELGRGGMGIVYEALQVSLGRSVAVKVLPFAAAVDEKQILRFKNEAQAAAHIDHPHIVPVFAVGHEHGIHFFAMQLIRGPSLNDYLVQQRMAAAEVLDDSRASAATVRSETLHRVQEVARLGVQAAEALHAAHEIGVVHRDVKPSNLLLDEQGKLWVTDFGLARCQADHSVTEPGKVLGTMRYMSPEQARGQSALVDHRTDVYSLGLTLYELAALRHPSEANADPATVFDFGHGAWRRPRHWNRYIPVDFENILLKALAEGRDERYATAQELADDLRRFLEGQPIQARRPSLGARLGKWARRHRKAVAVAVGTGLLGFVGCVAALAVIAAERSAKELAYQAARANHRRAEDNFRDAQAKFQQARAMLDQFGSQVADRLAEVPGAEGVRRELLADMLPYYRDFAAQANDDPAVQADLARTFSKIGYLSEELGSLEDSQKAYEDARTVLEQLVLVDLASPDPWRALGVCCNNLGQVLQRDGRHAAAREQLERALAIGRHLVERHGESIAFQTDLATTHGNLGLLSAQTGDRPQAAAHYREAIRIQESLVRRDPANDAHRRPLAASCNNISELCLPSRPAEAERWVRRALALQFDLARANPGQRRYQSDLALTYSNLGAIFSRQKKWGDAEPCFRDAIAIQQRLVDVAPLVAAYRRDLAATYNNFGMAQTAASEATSAMASFRRALELQRELLERHPHDVAAQSGLAVIHNNLGMALRQQGESTLALAEFRQAIAAQRHAQERAPQADSFRESLSKHLYNYADTLRSMGRAAEAAAVALERRALWAGHAQRLLQVAEELAITCRAIELPAARDPFVAEVAATLQQAQDAGLEKLPDQAARPFDILMRSTSVARLDDATGPEKAATDSARPGPGL